MEQSAYWINIVEWCDRVAVAWRRKLDEKKEQHNNYVSRLNA
jgi:hypothetical protein